MQVNSGGIWIRIQMFFFLSEVSLIPHLLLADLMTLEMFSTTEHSGLEYGFWEQTA